MDAGTLVGAPSPARSAKPDRNMGELTSSSHESVRALESEGLIEQTGKSTRGPRDYCTPESPEPYARQRVGGGE